MWKRGEIAPQEQFFLFSTIFSVYLYFQESNYIFICEIWLLDLSFFLNSANLICRDTDITKYFREFLDFEITRVDCKMFFSLEDDPRPGRPADVISQEMIDRV